MAGLHIYHQFMSAVKRPRLGLAELAGGAGDVQIKTTAANILKKIV